MQLKQLNFIHFFISDTEYMLEVDTINEVVISKGSVKIYFVPSPVLPSVAEFFAKNSEENMLFFFGNNDTKYDSPVVSRNCSFTGSTNSEKSFYLEFKIKDI